MLAGEEEVEAVVPGWAVVVPGWEGPAWFGDVGEALEDVDVPLLELIVAEGGPAEGGLPAGGVGWPPCGEVWPPGKAPVLAREDIEPLGEVVMTLEEEVSPLGDRTMPPGAATSKLWAEGDEGGGVGEGEGESRVGTTLGPPAEVADDAGFEEAGGSPGRAGAGLGVLRDNPETVAIEPGAGDRVMNGDKAGGERDGVGDVETAEEEAPRLEEAALRDAVDPSTDPKEAPGGESIPGGEADSGEEEAEGEAEGAGGGGRVPDGGGGVPSEAAGVAATAKEEEA